MNERRQLAQELDDIQQQMKELEIRYEQYFAGVEKREPYKERQDLARRLRHYTNRRIIQTDLKFRYQGLTSRFMTYGQYWDRILRLIDEGKYHRHLAKSPGAPAARPASAQAAKEDEADRLCRDLAAARQQCGQQGAAPSREQVTQFLAAQRDKISDRFGDRPVEFMVDTRDGKPRIKVRLKKP